jgi:hypothetical protein
MNLFYLSPPFTEHFGLVYTSKYYDSNIPWSDLVENFKKCGHINGTHEKY